MKIEAKTCMRADPEREAEAERHFNSQLKACDGPTVIDGSDVGPYPLKHNPSKKVLWTLN